MEQAKIVNRNGGHIRPASLKKYRDIQARFRHLYQVERRRIDDVHQVLVDEFYIGHNSILMILKMDLD